MKNILICLEKLDIGGVQTAVISQAIAMKKKGNNIYILGKYGKYVDKVKEMGIEYIEHNFELENNISIDKSNQIEQIIKAKDIQEVHIHSFTCIPTVVTSCINTNIPYIAFIHEGIPTTYNWFEETYDIYKYIFKLYFENAYKIICITENVKKYNMQKFKINEDKYIVIKNSIDFEQYNCKNSKTSDKIKDLLLISRMDNEKEQSIKNAIDLFDDLCKTAVIRDCTLTIVGDGKNKENIENYIKLKKSKKSITMIGESTNINELIAKTDAVIGMGRCILEAIAMKKIAIITGYEEIKGIVNNQNIKNALEENFSGRGLEKVDVKKLSNQMMKLKKKDIEEIINYNYEFIINDLDVNKNIYWIEGNVQSQMNDKSIIKSLFDILYNIQKIKINNREEMEEVWKSRLYFEEQNKRKENEIKELKAQIDFKS